jgi:hypothetical protein
MSEEKERATEMNYIALEQEIMRIPLVIGGRKEPSDVKSFTIDGNLISVGSYFEHGFEWRDVVEGKNILLGTMTSDNLLPGMSSSGGEVTYVFVLTKNYYVLFAVVQLSEDVVGKSEPAQAPIAWMHRSLELESKKVEELSNTSYDWPYLYPSVALLQAHFSNIFDYISSKDEAEIEFDSDVLMCAFERFLDTL